MEKITLSKNAPHGLHLPYQENSGEASPGVDLRPGDSADVAVEHLQEGARGELARMEKLGLVAFGGASPTYVAPETASAKQTSPAASAEIADLKAQLAELKALILAGSAAPVPPPLPDAKPSKPGK